MLLVGFHNKPIGIVRIPLWAAFSKRLWTSCGNAFTPPELGSSFPSRQSKGNRNSAQIGSHTTKKLIFPQIFLVQQDESGIRVRVLEHDPLRLRLLLQDVVHPLQTRSSVRDTVCTPTATQKQEAVWQTLCVHPLQPRIKRQQSSDSNQAQTTVLWYHNFIGTGGLTVEFCKGVR